MSVLKQPHVGDLSAKKHAATSHKASSDEEVDHRGGTNGGRDAGKAVRAGEHCGWVRARKRGAR